MRTRAFSLAELMIALAILGIGLLFIAAALPVGIDYARQSSDITTADAAVNDAASQISLTLATSTRLVPSLARFDYRPLQESVRLDRIFRPRMGPAAVAPLDAGPFEPRNDYEPFIKVRPLSLSNVSFQSPLTELAEPIEFIVGQFIQNVSLSVPAHRSLEFDDPALYTGSVVGGAPPHAPRAFDALFSSPALSAASRVFPAITPARSFHADDFAVDGGAYRRYTQREINGTPNPLSAAELQKIRERRIGWIAFYRRLSYDKVFAGPNNIDDGAAPPFQPPSPPSPPPPTDDVRVASDPLAYEVIIVATRRPTEQHRFAVQSMLGNGTARFVEPRAAAPAGEIAGVGGDRVLPSAWLVTLDTAYQAGDANNGLLQGLVAGTDYVGSDRTLNPSFVERPNLKFKVTREVGALIPVGSLLIPAANDANPYVRTGPPDGSSRARWTQRQSGFVPHSPDALPIYEVSERPDDTTVLVKPNGSYPWVFGSSTLAWPVWVIPPAFVERDGTGQPVYDRRSPILSVARRVVHIPEVQP